MKELDDLLEQLEKRLDQTDPSKKLVRGMDDIDLAYIAYINALNTPPEFLPEPPEGKKWVRVEYGSWRSAREGDYLVYKYNGKFIYTAHSPHPHFFHGLGQALGHGWRLVDDPDCDPDTWEKIAECLERITNSDTYTDDEIRDCAGRIRKLAAKEVSNGS